MTDAMQLVLASASPRRLELLSQLGLHAQVDPAAIDESPLAAEAPADYVLRIATAKAAAVAARYPETALIIGADTSVVLDNRILGKPGSAAECKKMLGLLSGRSHSVLSAVCVQRGNVHAQSVHKSTVALSRSTVRMRSINAAEIDAYCQLAEPHDKAGSYAVQGLAAIFIEEISGSYSGIMGLPLFETSQLLANAGVALIRHPQDMES